jgi:DNA-binding transcriptional ArsR family regulator
MKQVDFFAILADPTRLAIIEALLEGEQQVNDLVERMDIHQSGVSRHLRILSEAGFVQMRPDGARRLYALKPEPFRELDEWADPFRSLWEVRLDRFGVQLARRKKAREKN